MTQALVRLDPAVLGPHHADPPATFGAVMSGSPRERFVSQYEDGRFASGVWQCSEGIVEMRRWPQHELCVLLAGRVIITPEGGQPQEYRAGDAFAIPRGFTGTWDIREPLRKYYAMALPSPWIERVKAPLRRLKGMLVRAMGPLSLVPWPMVVLC